MFKTQEMSCKNSNFRVQLWLIPKKEEGAFGEPNQHIPDHQGRVRTVLASAVAFAQGLQEASPSHVFSLGPLFPSLQVKALAFGLIRTGKPSPRSSMQSSFPFQCALRFERRCVTGKGPGSPGKAVFALLTPLGRAARPPLPHPQASCPRLPSAPLGLTLPGLASLSPKLIRMSPTYISCR